MQTNRTVHTMPDRICQRPRVSTPSAPHRTQGRLVIIRNITSVDLLRKIEMVGGEGRMSPEIWTTDNRRWRNSRKASFTIIPGLTNDNSWACKLYGSITSILFLCDSIFHRLSSLYLSSRSTPTQIVPWLHLRLREPARPSDLTDCLPP